MLKQLRSMLKQYRLFFHWFVAAPDKYLCEISQSFVNHVTFHSLDPSIESSFTKEVGFIFTLQSEIIF